VTSPPQSTPPQSTPPQSTPPQSTPPSTRVLHVTVDCADASALAGFWAHVLGYRVAQSAGPDFAMLEPPAGTPSPGWLFFRVPEPKSAKNRVHLDLDTDDLAAEVRRLVGLGATVVHEKDQWQTRWCTLTDPEGNEFCVVQRQRPERPADDA
jgi:predicted enzyme related to lactoylglutathione lyase